VDAEPPWFKRSNCSANYYTKILELIKKERGQNSSPQIEKSAPSPPHLHSENVMDNLHTQTVHIYKLCIYFSCLFCRNRAI